MDEVYTCKCGCQKWIIHDRFIECGSCSEKYYLRTVILTGPSEFNENYGIKKRLPEPPKGASDGE